MRNFIQNAPMWACLIIVLLVGSQVTTSSAQISRAQSYAERQYEFLDPITCIYDRSTAFSGVYNEWASGMQKNVINLRLMRDISDQFYRLEACPAWPKDALVVE